MRFLETAASAAAAKSLQSCPTLCDPTDSSPPGPAIPGILQARTLEWVAISFSNAWKWKAKVKSFSRVRLLATSWTQAYQAPPSMEFSRQEYWSGVPLPSLSYILTTSSTDNLLLGWNYIWYRSWLTLNYPFTLQDPYVFGNRQNERVECVCCGNHHPCIFQCVTLAIISAILQRCDSALIYCFPR